MKEETAFKMSEKDNEILKILSRIGFNHPKGKVLIYLLNFGEGKSRDIEQTMDLRQPEVSVAMRQMQDFLETKKLHKKGTASLHARGRPIFIYRLKKPMSEIVDKITKNKIDNIQKNIEKLKEYILE